MLYSIKKAVLNLKILKCNRQRQYYINVTNGSNLLLLKKTNDIIISQGKVWIFSLYPAKKKSGFGAPEISLGAAELSLCRTSSKSSFAANEGCQRQKTMT